MSGYIGKGQPVAIDSNSVETVDIIDDAVTNAKIATNAVTGDSIAANAVGLSELSASGTASSSTYLRGDNTWATVASTVSPSTTLSNFAL